MRMHQIRNFNRAEAYSTGMTRKLQVQCYLNHLKFRQEVLQNLSLSFDYPIYRYSKVYFQIAVQLGINSKKLLYQMPFINYHNFI